MRVAASQLMEMQTDARVIGEAAKKFGNEFNGPGAEHRRFGLEIVNEVRPSTDVDGCCDQSFIKRTSEVAETLDAHAFPQRLF